MDSFLGSFSHHNFSNYEDQQNDSLANISSAMNRSKLLLNEMIANPNQTSNTPSRLLKASVLQQKPLLSNTIIQDSQIDQKEQQSSIYTQFKIDTNKFIDEDLNLVELLKSYSAICTEHSHFLKEKLQYLNINRQKDLYNSIVLEQDEMEKERNLWNLINILFADEQETKNGENDDDFDLNSENMEELNEVAIVRNLEKNNPLLRRIKLVIEWLEKIAAESNYLKLIREKMSAFSEKCSNWEHTLHHLKSSNFGKKEKIQFSGRDFVNELDPDAPIRQGKPLHDLDQEDEYKLMEYIFAFIRAGDLNSARDFCLKIGQPWRAATLEGFKLFNDENYGLNNNYSDKMNEQQEIFKNEGNLNRDIWRLMVHKLIKDEHFSPYEKAVYASLAGFVGPVIPICKTYLDYVWVYFKALYNQIIEKEIRQKITVREFLTIPYDPNEEQLFSNFTKTSGQAAMPTIAQIFDRIKVLINNSTNAIISDNVSSSITGLNTTSQIIANLKTDAQKPFSIILKHIICSGIDGFNSGTNELIDYLKMLVTTEQQNGLLLRFSSHLSLFYRSASYKIKNESLVQIIDSYVQYLTENKYKEIIAYYASQLTSDLQIKRYSKFLQTITDNKERILLLKLAKERNMNVQAITLNIVDNLSKPSGKSDISTTTLSMDQTVSGLSTTAFISKTTDLITSKTGQLLNDEDKTKINAIDWIVYDPSQRFKLLEYANLTMRYFLLERQNFEATKTVFSKIPSDTITIILTQYNYAQQLSSSNLDSNFQQIIDAFPKNVTNSIKEYLCFKHYIEAINLYNEWFDFYHREKPIKPTSKISDGDSTQIQEQSFAEKMSYEFQLKQYEDLSARWYSKALIYCDKVKAKFFSVLKFPFGGWMIDIKVIEDLIEDDDNSNESENNIDDENETNMNVEDEDSEMRQDSHSNRKLEMNRRKKQLNELRKLYLPNICFVLLDMLSKMNLNKELIRLSDLIASENYKLFALFDNKQLRCLLNKIADSSINLLDAKMDYLGYN